MRKCDLTWENIRNTAKWQKISNIFHSFLPESVCKAVPSHLIIVMPIASFFTHTPSCIHTLPCAWPHTHTHKLQQPFFHCRTIKLTFFKSLEDFNLLNRIITLHRIKKTEHAQQTWIYIVKRFSFLEDIFFTFNWIPFHFLLLFDVEICRCIPENCSQFQQIVFMMKAQKS